MTCSADKGRLRNTQAEMPADCWLTFEGRCDDGR